MSASSTSSNVPRLLVKRLKDNAVIPVRQSPLAAGYDLSSTENTTVPSGGTVLVKTGLSIACPPGTYGRVAPRSGLAYKHSIDVGAGVIDADYRGEVGVILFNFGQKDFEIKEGDRIAQLVLEKIALADVEEVQDLDETLRGSGGFGSTGVAESKRQRTITPNPEEEKKE
jgi:dUTP pyrophosphatase